MTPTHHFTLKRDLCTIQRPTPRPPIGPILLIGEPSDFQRMKHLVRSGHRGERARDLGGFFDFSEDRVEGERVGGFEHWHEAKSVCWDGGGRGRLEGWRVGIRTGWTRTFRQAFSIAQIHKQEKSLAHMTLKKSKALPSQGQTTQTKNS